MNVRQICWEGVGGLRGPSDTTIAQLKYDGSQYHLHIANGRAYGLTSKRVSKKTGLLNDRIKNFPLLKNIRFPFTKETVLVVEVVAEHLRPMFEKKMFLDNEGKPMLWANRCALVSGIMNSLPENLAEGNPLKMVVHDVLMHEGREVTGPYKDRYYTFAKHFPAAGEFGANIKNGSLLFSVTNIPCTTKMAFDELFKETIGWQYEGLLLKDMDGFGSLKRKRKRTAECFIIGFTNGQGKYAQQIGAIELGVFTERPTEKILAYMSVKDAVQKYLDSGIIVKVGQCSGMTDAMREQFSRHKKTLPGTIVEVEFMDWTGKKMRHPRYKKIREDKLLSRVTMEQFGE